MSNKLEYTCNKCKAELKQHKSKKKYFWCEWCNIRYECWLPMKEIQIQEAIETAKEKWYY